MEIKYIKFKNEDKNISPTSLLDKLVGDFLKFHFEKDLIVSFPANDNWGSKFRIKEKKASYDIIVCFMDTPKYLMIQIIPTQNFFQKLLTSHKLEQNILTQKISHLVKKEFPYLTYVS